MDSTTVLQICQVLFWSMIVLAIYPYAIYPVLLWIASKISPRPWRRDFFEVWPKLSIIIAAHNEEKILPDKLSNTLALDYPADRLEVLVASDCSEDRTDTIAQEHGSQVRLVRLNERSGKQVALNRAAEAAVGEIFAFTDASVILPTCAAKNLVRNFSDPQVGAVSSVIRIISNDANANLNTAPEKVGAEGVYLNLDISIRSLESASGSAVGCCGSCYAVRRECFVPFDAGACNDFVSALDAVKHGFRVVFEPEAIGFMKPAKDSKVELKRKIRTISGGLDTFWKSKAWINGYGKPAFWWRLMSHKVARWLGPPALLIAGLSAVVGSIIGGDLILTLAAIGCVLGLACGLLGLAVPTIASKFFPIRLATFILVSWWAAIAAWLTFLRGEKQVIWQPTTR